MSAPPVLLDFVAPRVRTTLTGVLLLLIGSAVLATACFEYRAATTKRAVLEAKLALALARTSHKPANTARANALSEETTGIARELGTPWTAVLSDLEVAAQDTKGQVAVLSVEPDHDKHRVRISGESRDLSVTLAYLRRLQQSNSLRFPMLDSHEVVASDNDHPVRFAMTADWRESP
jgi:Tfp pilus assembly protein PilN